MAEPKFKVVLFEDGFPPVRVNPEASDGEFGFEGKLEVIKFAKRYLEKNIDAIVVSDAGDIVYKPERFKSEILSKFTAMGGK